MGEYLKMKNGQDVKIGTCEDLYYTTHNQFLQNMYNFKDQKLASSYLKPDIFRFRFPFPDEDFKIGDHNNFNRGVLISVPKDLGIEMCHRTTTVRVGFYYKPYEHSQWDEFGIEIPCIQDTETEMPLKIYDWHNAKQKTQFEVTQQKIVTLESGELQLQTVVRCAYCGNSSRLDNKEVQALVDFDQKHPDYFDELQKKIIETMDHGYKNPVPTF